MPARNTITKNQIRPHPEPLLHQNLCIVAVYPPWHPGLTSTLPNFRLLQNIESMFRVMEIGATFIRDKLFELLIWLFGFDKFCPLFGLIGIGLLFGFIGTDLLFGFISIILIFGFIISILLLEFIGIGLLFGSISIVLFFGCIHSILLFRFISIRLRVDQQCPALWNHQHVSALRFRQHLQASCFRPPLLSIHHPVRSLWLPCSLLHRFLIGVIIFN
jgi:hypothetical protein